MTTYFIAGTDTDIGKTVAACEYIKKQIQDGSKVAPYKPVAAGCKINAQGKKQNGDALALMAVSNIELSYDEVNPYPLMMPASPHLAAPKDEVEIDLTLLTSGLKNLQQKADIVVVEGAGGWRVPLTNKMGLSTWVIEQKLPVIIVVGIKLGCLNHALLTYEAIKNDGLEVAGWIANSPEENPAHYNESIAWLKEHLKAPLLMQIPYLKELRSQSI